MTTPIEELAMPYAVPFELTGTGTAWAQVIDGYRKPGGVGTFRLDPGAYMVTIDYNGPEKCELNIRATVNEAQIDWNVATVPAGADGVIRMSSPGYVTVTKDDDIAMRVRTVSTVQASITKARRVTVRVYPVGLYGTEIL